MFNYPSWTAFTNDRMSIDLLLLHPLLLFLQPFDQASPTSSLVPRRLLEERKIAFAAALAVSVLAAAVAVVAADAAVAAAGIFLACPW